jgi:hypothetical protein
MLTFNRAEQRETFFEVLVFSTVAIEGRSPIAQSFVGGCTYREFKIVPGVWHFFSSKGVVQDFRKLFLGGRSGESQEVGGIGGRGSRKKKVK